METKTPTRLEKAYDYILQFRDVRAVGLLLFLVVVLLISWSGVKVIDTNYRLQKQINEYEQHNGLKKLANTNLKLENEYYRTNQYLDISARQNFGLAAPGETLVNISPNVALAHTVDLPDGEQVLAKKTKEKQPAYQRNFQSWIDFLFHRETD
ncbi:MAG TPA: septum formation initiator family protein [Candidatus Saccharimonadales bacterium]|nr:septum formation initiator family protein [Candidatus Saccharimonadales bacterium]